MPWPPTLPPSGRTNDTPTKDAHPGDHNTITAALATIVAQLTNAPRGIVGQTLVTASSPTTTTTIADMPGSTLTFTPDPARRYRIWAAAIIVASIATNVVSCRIRDATNANLMLADYSVMPTAANLGHAVLPTTTYQWAAAVPVTLKISYVVQAGAGNVYLYADNASPGGNTRLVVEDIGPITPVAVP